MLQDLERVKENARQASTEDLLDRVTIFRDGMEAEALPILEEELRSRGVSEEALREHTAARRRQGTVYSAGLPARCSVCQRPAVVTVRRWHRIWRILPIFPVDVDYCAEHRP